MTKDEEIRDKELANEARDLCDKKKILDARLKQISLRRSELKFGFNEGESFVYYDRKYTVKFHWLNDDGSPINCYQAGRGFSDVERLTKSEVEEWAKSQPKSEGA